MDLSGPGIDVKLKERKKERKKVPVFCKNIQSSEEPLVLGLF
jgi:hypothetical protein